MRAHPVFNTMPHTQTSSYQKPTMVMSLHHHGNNNQTQTWKQMKPSECVTKWNLDGNSKQPFPKINKTNIQLQLNSKASKDQVWLKHKHSNSFHLIIISYFKFISSNHNIYPNSNSILILIHPINSVQNHSLLMHCRPVRVWNTTSHSPPRK